MKRNVCVRLGPALVLVASIAVGTASACPTNFSLSYPTTSRPALMIDKLKFVGNRLAIAQQTSLQLPSYPLTFGAFVLRFDAGGTFTLEGKGWPSLSGNWKSKEAEIELSMSGGPGGCDGPGRYQFRLDGKHVTFNLVADDCIAIGRKP